MNTILFLIFFQQIVRKIKQHETPNILHVACLVVSDLKKTKILMSSLDTLTENE